MQRPGESHESKLPLRSQTQTTRGAEFFSFEEITVQSEPGCSSPTAVGGDYRYAREDKDVDVQLLLFESFVGFGRGVREILRKAADVLQNKLTRAQYAIPR